MIAFWEAFMVAAGGFAETVAARRVEEAPALLTEIVAATAPNVATAQR
jgi:hypothetical protein